MGKHLHTHQYSIEDQTLLELSHTVEKFQGHHHHHHHHHHEHTAYAKPKELNTSLGLYALKKLSAMNPKFLNSNQRRMLEPVAPGFLSYVAKGVMVAGISSYVLYIWHGFGYQAFLKKPVTAIPLAGMIAFYKGAEFGINYLREQLFYFQRRKLVENYKLRYGNEFLLNALDPAFKFDEKTHD